MTQGSSAAETLAATAKPIDIQSYSVLLLFFWLVGTMLLWWFAFYDYEGGESEWLERARTACFGTDAHGLPNAGGWLLLTLAPLLLLSSLVLAFGDSLRGGLKILCSKTSGKALVFALALLVFTQAAWAAGVISSKRAVILAATLPFQTGSFPDNYPLTLNTAPDFSLVKHDGSSVSLSSLRGKTVILTFAFAHCLTVCPTLISAAKSALAAFPEGDIQLVVVTLDPWRDTPKALDSIRQRWALPENALVLSGTVNEIEQVLSDYQYQSVRDEKTGDLTHPAIMYVVSPAGQINYVFNNPSAEWLIGAIAKSRAYYQQAAAAG